MELENKIRGFINAGNYEDICDFSIIPPEGKYVTNDLLLKDSIIFCKTDFIDYLFESIKNSDKNYILVTHHSDYPIDTFRFSKKPNNIKKWFAINVTHKDDSLITIPLGLKTHKGIYLEEKYMTKWFVEESEKLKQNKKEMIVYCNWTNTNEYRNTIIDQLNNNNIKYILESGLSFDNYAKNMSKCKFVISPPGNGIDCHRTWEALYMGCIPIVIKNDIYDNWSDLPILQVESYSQLTNETLENFLKKDFNSEMIEMEYWTKKIKQSL
jgi:UDP-N-acetylglucosamine 2-epimerase